MLKLFLVLIFLFSQSSWARKTGRTWRINQDHSEILFKVPYLTISEVSGRFNKFKGRVFFDDDMSLVTSIKLRIKNEEVSFDYF
jgi:polyisoprenoid-binding protein YceI